MQVDKFLNDMNAMMRNLEKLPMPTVAAVQGPAMGGGTEFALCCDLRTGQRETTFALPEVKLGIIPGAGGTQRLTHLLGRSKAMELIFTGRRVNVEEALELGEPGEKRISVRADFQDSSIRSPRRDRLRRTPLPTSLS